MLIKVTIRMSRLFLPKDNRPLFVSLIKNVLSGYSEKLYNNLYLDNTIKKMTFSVRFNTPRFLKDSIKLGDSDVNLLISTSDPIFAIDLYNALIMFSGKRVAFLGVYEYSVERVKIENHKNIQSDSIYIKFLSPLLLRNHEKGKKDYYSTFEDSNFNKKFFDIVSEQLKRLHGKVINSDELDIQQIKPSKTVSMFFKNYVSCSLGIYKLTSHRDILNLLYQDGVGSRRSEGFGMFEIVRACGL